MTTQIQRLEAAGPSDEPRNQPEPMLSGKRPGYYKFLVYVFVLVPPAVLALAVPFLWGWGISWIDVSLFVLLYFLTCLGITAGYHRHFTHGAYKAKPWLRVALAGTGSMAFQGTLFNWVADHRRHHAYSDRDGDPHSPWQYGSSFWGLARGFFHAHMGWLFRSEVTNHNRYVKDLMAKSSLVWVDRHFALFAVLSLSLPAALGGLISWSWQGAITGFLWGGLARIFALQHVTWSINSICHMFGSQPFKSRDQSRNLPLLAIVSCGESYHNLHHADPTCARHGVLRGQIDITARLIWMFEKLGWAWNVRWSSAERQAKLAQV